MAAKATFFEVKYKLGDKNVKKRLPFNTPRVRIAIIITLTKY